MVHSGIPNTVCPVEKTMTKDSGRQINRIWMRLSLLFIVLSLSAEDNLHLSPSQQTVTRHLFSIESWILTNSKPSLGNTLKRLIGGQEHLRHSQVEHLEEYFDLGREVRSLENQLNIVAIGAFSDPRPLNSLRAETIALERQAIRILSSHRDGMRVEVEPVLEHALSKVLLQEHLTWRIGPINFLFPPVDFRFDRLPNLLSISPRNNIFLQETILLDADLTGAEIERIEKNLLHTLDVSSVVLPLRGLATYPSIISDTQTARETLQTVAHEWIHQFWFFNPLGRNYWDSPEMTTLNETAAEMVGRELGDLAFHIIDWSDQTPNINSEKDMQQDSFEFRKEMSKTRMEVDLLLDSGRIEKAEEYMEARRRIFLQNGYYIRKLNQAYFAFHGTYAQTGASNSPIADQLTKLRETSTGIGKFTLSIKEIRTYDEFLTLLHDRTEESRNIH